MLNVQFDIRVHEFRATNSYTLPISLIRQIIFLIKNRKARAILCMFAGHHSLLPAIFAKFTGKPLILIAGGADAVSFPQFGYGNFRKPLLAWVTKKSYQLSTFISPVADALIFQQHRFLPENSSPQGILAFTHIDKEKFIVIPNGYDPYAWKIAGDKERKGCITVATHIETNARKIIKGIDTVLAVAEKMPAVPFCIAGCNRKDLPEHLPVNIRVTGPLNAEQLEAEYNSAAVYLQLSVSEGFPNALCEAMLCGCVPIVSSVGAMPEITGDCGYLLNQKDPETVQQLILAALSTEWKTRSAKSRERISTLFTETNRGEMLSELITNAINSKEKKRKRSEHVDAIS
ncbi:MAG: glycosyltransferase family 4 protein [Crocinitomicaceae bacterium]|nr:glycosyltransferase family 4 protein [Crocinitomicaceae bacterium]